MSRFHGLVIVAVALGLVGGPAFAKSNRPPARPPLVIAEQGNFYVGGHEAETPSGKVVADAMYVEYQIPAHRTHRYPLVFVHGGASTGAGFWSTPDGREGWATLFLRKGYAVYVVDRPTLGRSAHFDAVDGPMLPPPTALPKRTGGEAPPAARPATRFPGKLQPGDPAYEQMVRGRQSTIEVPFGAPGDPLAISSRVDGIDREAGAALLDRIGPAILVTHSRAGTTGWQIADARPALVKAIIAAEPNGPPFYNAPPLGQPGDPVARPFGLTYAPIRFSPPVAGVADFGALVRAAPEGPDRIGCWLPQGQRRTITNLAHIPVLVVTGGSSYHAAYDHCTVAFLRWGGVPVEHVQLDQHGITGNTHGFPTETNNAEIAGLIARLLRAKGL